MIVFWGMLFSCTEQKLMDTAEVVIPDKAEELAKVHLDALYEIAIQTFLHQN